MNRLRLVPVVHPPEPERQSACGRRASVLIIAIGKKDKTVSQQKGRRTFQRPFQYRDFSDPTYLTSCDTRDSNEGRRTRRRDERRGGTEDRSRLEHS